MIDETAAVIKIVKAADMAIAYGDFNHARAIQFELSASSLLGAAIGAWIIGEEIGRAEAALGLKVAA